MYDAKTVAWVEGVKTQFGEDRSDLPQCMLQVIT